MPILYLLSATYVAFVANHSLPNPLPLTPTKPVVGNYYV